MPKWFVRKTYGYGWTPSTVMGWAVTLAFVLQILAASYFLNEQTTAVEWAIYGVLICLDLFWLFSITFLSAPPARWQWGEKPRRGTDATDTTADAQDQ